MQFKRSTEKGIGIWSIENYAANDFNTSSSTNSNHTKTNSTSSQNNSNDNKESNVNCKGKIKGNANSKIYHVPDGYFMIKQQVKLSGFAQKKKLKKMDM